jgi:hypothetical protein
MRRATIFLLALSLGACATNSNRPPPNRAPSDEGVLPASARHNPPARTPELDRENTEQRFGFDGAKATKEAKARAAKSAEELGVVEDKPKQPPPPPPPKKK